MDHPLYSGTFSLFSRYASDTAARNEDYRSSPVFRRRVHWELVCRVSVHHLVHRLTPLLTARFFPALRGLRKRPTHVVLSFIAIFVGEGRTTYTRDLRFYAYKQTAHAFTTNSYTFFLDFGVVPCRIFEGSLRRGAY